VVAARLEHLRERISVRHAPVSLGRQARDLTECCDHLVFLASIEATCDSGKLLVLFGFGVRDDGLLEGGELAGELLTGHFELFEPGDRCSCLVLFGQALGDDVVVGAKVPAGNAMHDFGLGRLVSSQQAAQLVEAPLTVLLRRGTYSRHQGLELFVLFGQHLYYFGRLS